MGLLDFILNIAGVLLWLNWRSRRLDPLIGATPATLVGTIRQTRPTRSRRWDLLLFLGLLIFFRAFLYRQLGPAVHWTPKLDLGVVTLAFRANEFRQLLLFSTLSLLRAVLIAYFWMLLLTAVNRRSASPDPLQKLIFLQLGRAAYWARWIQVISPAVMAGLLWLAIHPLLAHWKIISVTPSKLHLAGQCVLVGAGLLLSAKYLLPAVLALHLVTSYVYLGNSPVWELIANTSNNLLQPLRGLPLRIGRVDLTPLVGILLIIAVFNLLPLVRALLQIPWFAGSNVSEFFDRLILWPG